MIIKNPAGKTVATVGDPSAYFAFIEEKSGTVVPSEIRQQFTVEASDAEKKEVMRSRIAREVGDMPDLLADVSDILQITSRLLMRFLVQIVDTDNIATARSNVKADPDYALIKRISEAIENGGIQLTGVADDLERQLARISAICDIKENPVVIA